MPNRATNTGTPCLCICLLNNALFRSLWLACGTSPVVASNFYRSASGSSVLSGSMTPLYSDIVKVNGPQGRAKSLRFIGLRDEQILQLTSTRDVVNREARCCVACKPESEDLNPIIDWEFKSVPPRQLRLLVLPNHPPRCRCAQLPCLSFCSDRSRRLDMLGKRRNWKRDTVKLDHHRRVSLYRFCGEVYLKYLACDEPSDQQIREAVEESKKFAAGNLDVKLPMKKPSKTEVSNCRRSCPC
jgi:hypothetical protein